MAELAGLLEPSALSAQVRGWLKEDVPSFDYGGAVVGDGIETAVLYAKSKVWGFSRVIVDFNLI